MPRSWSTTSPQETRAVAAEVMGIMGRKGVLLLEGDLGAGKTCFVQGLAEGMHHQELVTSPTYGLLKEYGDPPTLLHADLYRLNDEEDLLELGLEEWLGSEALCAIEWPDRASGFWPKDAWTLRILSDPDHETHRSITLTRPGDV